MKGFFLAAAIRLKLTIIYVTMSRAERRALRDSRRYELAVSRCSGFPAHMLEQLQLFDSAQAAQRQVFLARLDAEHSTLKAQLWTLRQDRETNLIEQGTARQGAAR